MSTFWSVFIIVITLGSIAGCAILLRWCVKDRMGVPEGESMGHSFDGIEELNNPLPKWWTYLFIATILFALGYLVVYPGLGNFAGVFGWKSAELNIKSLAEEELAKKNSKVSSAYDYELEKADASFGKVFKKLAYQADTQYKAITDIAKDKAALNVGKRLFLQTCSQCHGSTARGGNGFPNLTDDSWLYGGSGEQIKQSIMLGRNGLMPAGGGIPRTDAEVSALTAYALSLSGRKVDANLSHKGKTMFAVCSACHGADGKGNQSLGAPDLTDKTWLYGGSKKAVSHSIKLGRTGVMPAHKDTLGEDKVQLIAAYVFSLSNE